MMRSLATYFLLALFATPSAAAEWGTLKGRFTYGGDPPKLEPITPTKDVAFCGKDKIPNETLTVGEDGGLRDVIVWLYVRRGGDNPEIHPSYKEMAKKPVVLDNVKCVFQPHVAVVWTEQKLVLKNSDPVAHNSKIDTLNQDPINPLLPPNASLEHQFEEPERLPAGVSCSIHPWMKAYVAVQSHPYMAVSDEKGNFEIKNVPAGEWTFRFWHPTSGYVRSVTVNGEKTEWKFGRAQLTVKAGDNNLGEIKVDPSIFKLD